MFFVQKRFIFGFGSANPRQKTEVLYTGTKFKTILWLLLPAVSPAKWNITRSKINRLTSYGSLSVALTDRTKGWIPPQKREGTRFRIPPPLKQSLSPPDNNKPSYTPPFPPCFAARRRTFDLFKLRVFMFPEGKRGKPTFVASTYLSKEKKSSL